MNLQDLRGNGPDHVDDSNLGDGADDGGFDLNDYEGMLPCFHHTSRQPILHTTMKSRSSGAIPVTRQGISRGTVLSA